MISINITKSEAIKLVEKDGQLIRNLPKHYHFDKDVVLSAVKNNGYALFYASSELKNNFEIVMEAAKCKFFMIQDVSENLRDNKKIILTALSNNHVNLVFPYISARLRADIEVISIAVEKSLNSFFLINSNVYLTLNCWENLIKKTVNADSIFKEQLLYIENSRFKEKILQKIPAHLLLAGMTFNKIKEIEIEEEKKDLLYNMNIELSLIHKNKL